MSGVNVRKISSPWCCVLCY